MNSFETSSGKADKNTKTKAKKATAKSKAKAKQDSLQPSKFDGAGVTFRCKLFGCTKVSAARGDKISVEGIRMLKQEAKQNKKESGKSKQKVVINISIQGLKIYDEKTNELLYDHAVHKISFITHDPEDKKTFAYICNTPEKKGYTLFAVKHDKAAAVVTSNVYELFQVVLERRKAQQKAKSSAQGAQAPAPEQAVEAVEQSQSTSLQDTQTQSEDIYTASDTSKDLPSEPRFEENEQFQSKPTEEPVSNLLDWSDVPQTQAQPKTSNWVDMDEFLSGSNNQEVITPPSPGFAITSDGFFSQSAVDAISTNQETGSTSSGPFVLDSPQDAQTPSSDPFGSGAFPPSSNDPFSNAISQTPASSAAWGASTVTSPSNPFGGDTFSSPFPPQVVPGGPPWNNGCQAPSTTVQSPFSNNFGQVPPQQSIQSFPPQNTPQTSTQEMSLPKQDNNDPFADLSSFGETLGIGRARTKSKSAANSPHTSPCHSPTMGYRSAGHSPVVNRAADSNPILSSTTQNDVFGELGSFDTPASNNGNAFPAPTATSPSLSSAFPAIPPRNDVPSVQLPPPIPAPYSSKRGVPVLPPRVDLDFGGQQPVTETTQQNDLFGAPTTNPSTSPLFGDFNSSTDVSSSSSDPFSSSAGGLFDSTPKSFSQSTGVNDPYSSVAPSASSNSNDLFSSSDLFSTPANASTTTSNAFGDPFVSSTTNTSNAQSGFGDAFGTGLAAPPETVSSSSSLSQNAFGNPFGSSTTNTPNAQSGFGDAFGTGLVAPQETVSSSSSLSQNAFGDAFGSITSSQSGTTTSNAFGGIALTQSGTTTSSPFGDAFGTSSATTQNSLASPFGGTSSSFSPNAFGASGFGSASSTTVTQPSDPFGSSGAGMFNPQMQPALSPSANNQFGTGSWNSTLSTAAGSPFSGGIGNQPVLQSRPTPPTTTTTVNTIEPKKEDPFAAFAVDFGSFKT